MKALLFCWCVGGCAQEAPEPKKQGPIPVHLLEVTAESLAPTITRTFLGTISSEHSAKLAFEVGGRIVELLVEEGAYVEKGALLARLDSADFANTVKTLRTSVKTARLDHSRSRTLEAQGAESQARVESAKLRVDSAGGQLTSAQLRLAHTQLVAPFSGYIGRRLRSVNDSVLAKQPVLILQSASARRIEALIPEKDITLSRYLMRLQEGKDVVDARPRTDVSHRVASARPRVVLSIYPEREFPCEYVAISTTADPVTRSLTMTLRFIPPDDVPVFSGTSAQLLLDVPSPIKGLVVVPTTSIRTGKDDEQSVWMVDEKGKIEVRPVKVAQIAGENSHLAGLKEGDRIVISGVNRLRSGDIVTAFKR